MKASNQKIILNLRYPGNSCMYMNTTYDQHYTHAHECTQKTLTSACSRRAATNSVNTAKSILSPDANWRSRTVASARVLIATEGGGRTPGRWQQANAFRSAAYF